MEDPNLPLPTNGVILDWELCSASVTLVLYLVQRYCNIAWDLNETNHSLEYFFCHPWKNKSLFALVLKCIKQIVLS